MTDVFSSGAKSAQATMSGDLSQSEYASQSSKKDGYNSALLSKKRRSKNATLRIANSRLDIVKKMHNEFSSIVIPEEVRREWTLYYYPLVFKAVLVLYTVLLGLSTLLDWRRLSFKMLLLILVLRSVFALFFIYDLYMQFLQQKKQRRRVLIRTLFYVDALLCIYDIGLIAAIAGVLATKSDLFTKSSIGSAASMSVLLVLRRLSAVPIFRLYKLCMFCMPLWGLSKRIMISLRELLWTGVFVTIVIYGSSIYATMAFNDVADEEMDEFYGTLIRSMYTMFTVFTQEGWNEVCNRTGRVYPYCKMFFVVYVCFVTLTVMNIITGIILDTYLTASERLTGDAECEKIYGQQLALGKLISLAKKGRERFTQGGASGSSVVLIPDERPVLRTKSAKHDVIQDETVSKYYKYGLTLAAVPDGYSSSLEGAKSAPPKFQLHKDDAGASSGEKSVKYDDEHLHPHAHRKQSDVSYISAADSQVSRDVSDDEAIAQYDDIIDMTEREPIEILKDPLMQRLFEAVDIPEYLVYEVLNMYYLHGLKRITAAELYTACTRAPGKASGRHLLSLEIGVTKRLDDMERLLQRFKTDLTRALDRLEEVQGGASKSK